LWSKTLLVVSLLFPRGERSRKDLLPLCVLMGVHWVRFLLKQVVFFMVLSIRMMSCFFLGCRLLCLTLLELTQTMWLTLGNSKVWGLRVNESCFFPTLTSFTKLLFLSLHYILKEVFWMICRTLIPSVLKNWKMLLDPIKKPWKGLSRLKRYFVNRRKIVMLWRPSWGPRRKLWRIYHISWLLLRGKFTPWLSKFRVWK
jgi:hypothetical protein